MNTEIKIEDINIGDTVHCQKQIECSFSGGHWNDLGWWVPNKPKDGLNPIAFNGKVYCVMGNILMLDLEKNGACSVHIKNVVKHESAQGKVLVAA